MVAYFLERVSPTHLTEQALVAMHRLTTCVEWSPAFSVSAIRDLFTHWSIWVFVDYKVQVKNVP